MNIKIKNIIFLLFVFSFMMASFGQEGDGSGSEGTTGSEETINDQFTKIVSIPNSPEAEAFTKYGEYPINQYTGTPNIEIPIYTIKGRELDIPITLTYDASGIKVNQIASNVGLGWNLMVGGRISRQVRGFSDHYITAQAGYQSVRNPEIRESLLKYKDFTGSNFSVLYEPDDSFQEVVNKVDDFFYFLYRTYKSEIDIEQDYYSLNVLGLNEIIRFDLETYSPLVIGNENIKVEYGNINIGSNNDFLYWVITDDDGTQYFFGNALDGSSELAIAEKTKRLNVDDSPGIVNLISEYYSSWMLVKIISPNKKDIYEFNYYTNDAYSDQEIVINQQETHRLKEEPCGFNYPDEYQNSSEHPSISSVQYQYTGQILESIVHNGKEVVRFGLEDRSDIENGTNGAVKSISVYDNYSTNPEVIKYYEFVHSYFGDANSDDFLDKRLKLDKIKIGADNDNFYSFDYQSPDLVPNRRSYSIDRMGYFNGKYNEIPFEKLEFDLPDGYDDYVISGADRDVNEDYSKVGILKRIYFPTGGYTTFEYENHQDDNSIYPGLRIKSISSYTDQFSKPIKKVYQYTLSKTDSTSSLVRKIPDPFIHYVEPIQRSPLACLPDLCGHTPEYDEPVDPKILHCYIYSPVISGSPVYVYSDVIESNYSDDELSGYVHTKYNCDDINGWWRENTIPFVEHYYYSLSEGKINEQKIYDKDGHLLKQTTNTYSSNIPDNQTFQDTGLTLHVEKDHRYEYYMAQNIDGQILVYRTPLQVRGMLVEEWWGNGHATCNNILQYNWEICSNSYPDYHCYFSYGSHVETGLLGLKSSVISGYAGGLTESTTIEKFGDESVTNNQKIEYIPHTDIIRSSTITKDNGEKIKTIYTYVQDLDTLTPAEEKLLEQNKITLPIIVEKRKVLAGGTEITLSKQKTVFNLWPNEENDSNPDDDYVLPEFILTSKGNEDFEKRITYHRYDIYGNPIEISLTDGTKICYIWGYNHSKPVAKLENIAYEDIPNDNNELDNILNFDYENGSESDLKSKLNQLRQSLNDDEVFVSTYTYKPKVGVSSITDQRGESQYFRYNDDNKLEYVLNNTGEVLQKNEYNYKTKQFLTGGTINTVSDDGATVVFSIDTSDVSPVNSNLTYQWISPNGTIDPDADNGETVSVDYSCEELNCNELSVTCIVSDSNNQYYPVEVSYFYKPSACEISSDGISYSIDNANNEIIFAINNLNAGTDQYSIKWFLESNNDNGITLIDENPDDNLVSVQYDCNSILAPIYIRCRVTNENNCTRDFFSDYVYSPCIMAVTDIGAPIVDNANHTITCSLNVSGVNPEGLHYKWTITDWYNNGCSAQGDIDGIELPYNDQQGHYVFKYACGCGGTNPNNIGIHIKCEITHSAFSSTVTREADFQSITNTCNPQ